MTWTRDQFAGEDETGISKVSFAMALQTWAAMQDRCNITVAEAAMTFNVAPDLIVEVVGDEDLGHWMFLNGDPADPTTLIIELDGE
jgi:hypothetical protein